MAEQVKHIDDVVRDINIVTKESQAEEESVIPEYFTVSTAKFVLLSLLSFTLYNLYWFYKNWKIHKLNTGERFSPFWRTFFSPFFSWSFFSKIKIQAEIEEINVGYNVFLMGLLYLLLLGTSNLPGMLSIVSYLAFIPLLIVQNVMIKINKNAGHRGIVGKGIKISEIFVVLLGMTLGGIVIVGAMQEL